MAPSNWRKENVTPSFKEEDVGKLQAGQPYLSLQEYYGANSPDSHVQPLRKTRSCLGVARTD